MAEEKKTKAESKKAERVTVRIPMFSEKEEPDMFVGINGVNYLIPKNKDVEVPVFVKEELDRAERARQAAINSKSEMLRRASEEKI